MFAGLNPAEVPDVPEVGSPDGPWRTALWVAIYVGFAVALVVLLVRKLPRHED